jgi:TRAP-type C4-dicarboxylate transport system substrate-binding protein
MAQLSSSITMLILRYSHLHQSQGISLCDISVGLTNFNAMNHIAACIYYMIRKDWLEPLPADLKKIVLDSARQAAAYQNKMESNVQSESLKKMVAASLKVNEAADVRS